MHVVTGASDGIGRAVVASLARRGHPVLAVARRPEPLEALAVEYSTVTPLAVDVTTQAGRDLVLASLGGRVQALVHGAGSRVAVEPLTEIRPDALVEDLRVHVVAALELDRVLARHGCDRIVVFDSYSATTPREGWAAYSVVKAAAQMVARAATAELPDTDVLRLFPGAVRTPLLETVLDSPPSPARDVYRAMGESGAIAEPEAIGEWVADLVTSPRFGSAVLHHRDTRPPAERTASGGCLCGAVRYRIVGPMRDVVECHCERCRRTSGHHLAATRVAASDLHVDDTSTLRWYPPDADPAVEYGFCDVCGSSLFWRARSLDTVSVSAGTLDPPTGLNTVAVWFADEASDYVTLDPSVPTHPGEG